MNPAAIAIFFHKICSGVLEALIRPVDGKKGVLGEVSTYFGVVETNGRGMLHLHALIWLAGNVDFFDLRRRLLEDPDFARQMIEFLDSVILECIVAADSDGASEPPSRPSTAEFDTDEAYVDALRTYSNAVASKRQLHSQNHNSTCFKYNKKGTRECRFDFPRPKVTLSLSSSTFSPVRGPESNLREAILRQSGHRSRKCQDEHFEAYSKAPTACNERAKL